MYQVVQSPVYTCNSSDAAVARCYKFCIDAQLYVFKASCGCLLWLCYSQMKGMLSPAEGNADRRIDL